MSTQTFDITIRVDKDTGLLFASCKALPGYRVTGISMKELMEEIPAVLRVYVEAQGRVLKGAIECEAPSVLVTLSTEYIK